MADGLVHRLREPDGDPQGALILNHGRGADEHDLFGLIDELDPERRLLGVTTGAPLTDVPPGGRHWYLVPRVGYPDAVTFAGSYRALTSFLDELLLWWAEVGDQVAFSTISGGQYTHPHGVQFGGTRPSWSRRALESIWSEQLVGAADAVALDLHTGLGPMGRQTVFQTADADEPGAVAGAGWFEDWIYRTDRADPVDHGLLGPGYELAKPLFCTEKHAIEVGRIDAEAGANRLLVLVLEVEANEDLAVARHGQLVEQ